MIERLVLAEGSTRSAALLRIGLTLLVWSRFAGDLLPVRNLDPAWLALGASFYLSTTALLLGVFSRVSAVWAGGTLLVMVFGVGPAAMEPWTHHHTTLLALAVAMLPATPCGGSYSVDRWWAVTRAARAGAPPPAERAPVWGLLLLGMLTSTVYLWSAVDKTTWGFLSGHRLQTLFMHLYVGSDYPTFTGFAALCGVAAVLTVVLEYLLAFGLWVRRLQPALIPAGLLLHAIFYWALPVSTFSLTMAVLYLAYLDPDAVHDAIDRIS